MAENSNIEWTTHTFNPWIGCTRVSPGCVHCYAETLMADRYGRVEWGPKGARSKTAVEYWQRPIAWNRKAEKDGVRARVFCASLADVFDDHPSIEPAWREHLWSIIADTPWLDWQMLTKRPENVRAMMPAHWTELPPNVWIGTSVEDQRRADERVPVLLSIPARVRFLSVEPLLGPVDLTRVWMPDGDSLGTGLFNFGEDAGIDWVIVGGESGPGARPMWLNWARDVVAQCRTAGVAVFVKQLGARPRVSGDGFHHTPVQLRSAKGGDMSEWPADLRVREMPT